MGKSCGNCYRFNDGMYSTVCDECQVSGDTPPSMWKATDSEPEKKLQTGYAIIPMDEYLSLFIEIGDLRKENAGLKAQVETLNKYVHELLYDLNGITEVGEVNE
jgi:hypothetical protein